MDANATGVWVVALRAAASVKLRMPACLPVHRPRSGPCMLDPWSCANELRGTHASNFVRQPLSLISRLGQIFFYFSFFFDEWKIEN